MITQYEFGWLVGLLEGEGSFSYSSKGHTVWLEMTDKDVINKASSVITKITGKEHKPWLKKSKTANKDSYILQIRSRSAVLLMQTIVHHMHYRRRGQVWRALNNWTRPSKLPQLMELVDAHYTN